MAENNYSGEMDPELAALLGTGADNDPPPNFDDIFNDNNDANNANKERTGGESTVSTAGFPAITKRFESTPHDFFNDTNYYKTALSNEGDIAQRVHGILQKYLTTKDPKDRSVFRQQFIPPFWDFLLKVAQRASGTLPPPKRFLLRFGILHPTLLNAETRGFFSKIVVENELNQPVYYLDEWLSGVGTSVIRPSTTDEVKVSKSNNPSKLQQLLEKANGKFDGAKMMLKAREKERSDIESLLHKQINSIFERTPMREYDEISECLTDGQKYAITEIQNLLKDLLKNDHDKEGCIKDFISAEADVQSISEKIETEGGAVEVDLGAIDAEFNTVRQMAKMT